jgi:hypothetical protein
MHIPRRWRFVLSLLVTAAVAVPAAAQQPPATDQAPAPPAAPTAPPPVKKKPKPKPAPTAEQPPAATPAAEPGAPPPVKKKPKPKPAPTAEQPPAAAPEPGAPAPVKKKPKPATAQTPPGPAVPPVPAGIAGGAKPTLLGQYGEWGAYTASPGGKKICFAIAKPMTSETVPPNRPRNPSYMFISSRPTERVSNEVSIIIGYPFKPSAEATVDVGTTTFALYTQQDGAWIKNATDEGRLLETMRAGQSAVVKGMSSKGTRTIDTFSLKGFSQALDRTGQDCK